MIIDIILVVLIVVAIIKGFQRGLIVALFSFLAIIIGLAAALKLSAVVAERLGNSVKISDKWLPILSFALVFIGVVLLVRLGAKALQKTVEFVSLGFVNKIGGFIFYAALYITVFSIILFYAAQINIIKQKTIEVSVTYSFIQPWGPKAMDILAAVFPFLKDMFVQLQNFFGGVSGKISILR
jgi:membrane protein required for colicin V production